MIHYLAFIDEIGFDNGEYIYRFDFTPDTNVVWGEYFNITPAIIVPGLQPDKNSLSISFKARTDYVLNLAKDNNCFSMQDCIDGIIPMGFTEDTNVVDNEFPLVFNFADEYTDVLEKLNSIGIDPYDITEIQTGDDSTIDNLINGDQLDEFTEGDINDNDDF